MLKMNLIEHTVFGRFDDKYFCIGEFVKGFFHRCLWPDLLSGQLSGCLKVMAQVDLQLGLIAFKAQKYESD